MTTHVAPICDRSPLKDLFTLGSLEARTLIEISPKPLRRVVTRSSDINNGRFSSALMNKSQAAESDWEWWFCAFAELCPTVDAVYPQPTKLQLFDGRVAFPDFAVFQLGIPYFYEVKPDEKAARPEFIEKAAATARRIQAAGSSYYLTLRSDFFVQPVRKNVGTVLRRLWEDVEDDTLLALQAELADVGGCTIAELVERTIRWGGSFEAVLWFISRRGAFVDYRQPSIDRHSLILPFNIAGPLDPLLPRRRVAGA